MYDINLRGFKSDNDVPHNIPVLDDVLERVWKRHKEGSHLPSCGCELCHTAGGTTLPASCKIL